MKVYIRQGPTQQGPYSLHKVHEYYEEGYIKSEDLAWAEGDPDWLPILKFLRLYPKPNISDNEKENESYMSYWAGMYGKLKVILGFIIVIFLYWFFFFEKPPANAPSTLTEAEVKAKVRLMISKMIEFKVKGEDWRTVDDMKEILFGRDRKKMYPGKLSRQWSSELSTTIKEDKESWDVTAKAMLTLEESRKYNFESTVQMTSVSNVGGSLDTINSSGQWIFLDGFLLLKGKPNLLLRHESGVLYLVGTGVGEEIELFDDNSTKDNVVISLLKFQ